MIMKTKHTKEYAEKLGREFSLKYGGGRSIFVAGYMKAIEETAAPELLEACIVALKYFNGFDSPEQNEAAFHALNNAIKKATK